MRKSLHRDRDDLAASDGSPTSLSRSGPRPEVEFTAAQIVLFSRNIERAAVILWTDDTRAGYARLQELGARPVKDPAPWLGRLLIAWVEHPDGHLIQIVQTVQGGDG